MQLMLTGRNLSARAARRANLVDRLVRHPDMLRWEARKAVLAKRKSPPAPLSKRVMALGPVRGRVVEKMRAETGKKVNKNHYPAPFALIDLFEKHGDNPKAMMKAEIDAFVPLMASPTAQNLRRVFFVRKPQKARAARQGEARIRPRAWLAQASWAEISPPGAPCVVCVTLQDMDMERITPALDRAKKLFKKRLKTKQAVDAAMSRLEADVEGKGIPRADVLIEAVVEKLEVKQQIFADAEKRMKPDAIMATNTSSIELERIAENSTTLTADRAALLNPVAQLPLVEVIRSKLNDEEAIRRALVRPAIGKSPVVVKSARAFGQRALMPYMLEAVDRVEKGESPEQLDEAAVAFGMPMGPIELMDTVGLDVGASVARELGQKVREDSKFANWCGRKAGAQDRQGL